MTKWSSIRNKLENEYLAYSLRGHIQYFVTRYRGDRDNEGRASIRYDGKEIIKGCYWNNWMKAHLFPKDETYEKRIAEEMAYMDDTAIKLGIFDQRSFYMAFDEFDNQSIDKSLKSDNLLVRIFAILDRRVGKRRLDVMRKTITDEPEVFREFYAIRINAEKKVKKSNVEELICSKDFEYIQPYFYNYSYALRCELGIGKTDKEFSINAKKRAMEIYNILFSKGVDAVIFNYWINDYSDIGEAEINKYDKEKYALDDINEYVKKESMQLKILLEYQMKYRHVAIEKLKTYLEPEDGDYGKQKRNRVVCFSDGNDFNVDEIIDLQLSDRYDFEFGFVSFENECIYSVYDDRGCDVVFLTYDKMKEFYNTLKPYFLSYDVEEMERRYKNI